MVELLRRFEAAKERRSSESDGDRSAEVAVAEKARAARVLGEGSSCGLGKTLGHKAVDL
jgi:hypothetical protein